MSDRISISKRLQKSCEDLLWNVTYLSYRVHKRLARDIKILISDWRIPVRALVFLLRDFMFALIQTEELEQLNQILVKQLKNRYNDPTKNKKFVVGIDRARMKLYDCEQSAQEDILDSGQDDTPAFDKALDTTDWKFN